MSFSFILKLSAKKPESKRHWRIPTQWFQEQPRILRYITGFFEETPVPEILSGCDQGLE